MYNTTPIDEFLQTHVGPIKMMLERFDDEELETIADDPQYFLRNGKEVIHQCLFIVKITQNCYPGGKKLL